MFRLYQLYILVVFSCFILLFAISTYNLSDHIFKGGISYLLSNVLFLNFLEPSLPGVFEVRNVMSTVNGSLWTLFVSAS